MSVANKKGPVFDPGLCRCCGAMKKCRVLNVEYEYLGQKEVYSDIMMDCFGLLLSHLDGKVSDRLVCATCVTRLREAFAFKKQVLLCEQAFMGVKMGGLEVTQSQADTTQSDEVTIKRETEDHSYACNMSDRDDHIEDVDSMSVEVADADAKPEKRKLEKADRRHSSKRLTVRYFWNQTHDPTEPSDENEALKPETLECEDDMPLLQLTKTAGNDKQLEENHIGANARNMQSFWRMQHVPKDSPAKIPISKVQQQIRENDQSYMNEHNILLIVENSYVTPFKCRHNNLICHYCTMTFKDAQSLREHTNQHNPKKFKVPDYKNMTKLDLTRIDCRLCSDSITDLDELRRHLVTEHGKKFYSECKDTVLMFKLDTDVFKCAICLAPFPYFHALNKHMNEHYSNYICETCGLGFVDWNRFLTHHNRHDEGTYPCDTCGKLFKSVTNRELHIDRVHRKRGRVYCPKCDVVLMTHAQKQKHLVEVHGDQPLALPCTHCHRVFETRRTLTIHMRKEHLKDFRYECQTCGEKFFTSFALKNHMPTHTGERNFPCKVCHKTYPRLKTLKEHMRIHTNDRRYRCHICGQAFIQNCSLKGHMKSQHAEYG